VSEQYLRWLSIKPEQEDSHDDFKPIIKAQPDSSVEETIKSDISNNRVFIYMKVTFAYTLLHSKFIRAPAVFPRPSGSVYSTYQIFQSGLFKSLNKCNIAEYGEECLFPMIF
jgi:hypothetical protein